MRHAWRWAGVLVGAALLTWSAGAQAAPPSGEEHVRGDVVSESGSRVVVKPPAGGTVALELAPDVRVARVEKMDPASVKEGAFVGTTTVPQADGSMWALEVHVFPESMRGTGEGQRPWDLGGSSSEMTNGKVVAMRSNPGQGSTMTNATVATVRRGDTGETLALEFQGGKATVLVPPGTTVVKVEPGSRAEIAPGAHVFAAVSRGPGGTLVAKRVIVGKGIAPPM